MDFSVGYQLDPQPVPLRPFALPFLPEDGKDDKKEGTDAEEAQEETEEREAVLEQDGRGKVRLKRSAAAYYASLPPSVHIPHTEEYPPFVYAVGKGESPFLEVRACVRLRFVV